MAEDKIKDAECDKLLAYSPPAPEAAQEGAGAEGGEEAASGSESEKEPAGAEESNK